MRYGIELEFECFYRDDFRTLNFDYDFDLNFEAVDWVIHFIKEFEKVHEDYFIYSAHVFKYRNFGKITILEI